MSAGRRGRCVPLGAAALSVLTLLVPLLLLWAAPGPASAVSYQVAMKGYAFSPATLTVPVGSTVTWTNQDTAPHDVKTTSGPASIHSPMLQKGKSWSFTFTTAGSYGYYCTVHPDMTARIVVQPAATSAAPTRTQSGSDHHESGTGAAAGAGHHTATMAPTAPAASASTGSSAARSKSPAPTKSPSAPPTSAPAAAAAPSAATPQAVEPTGSARPLDGLLVLAGVVAGVAVLCLLLVGSRSAAREGRDSA
ncbi:cupredoxin family copper-binding protein [Streptomyces sp. NPDC048484]|uniref:cupredoxin domain-containing protein n=1 Tax=Streptomyces sp. NPDC048484 TaxID=3155146 RepID=UPI00342C0A90